MYRSLLKNWWVVVVVLIAAGLQAQVNVEKLQSPDEYSIIYVSDLIQNAEAAPVFFQYRLTPEIAESTPPPEIAVEVEFIANVPELGLENEQIFWVKTDPFPLIGTITLSNRSLSEGVHTVMSTNGPIEITASPQNVHIISGEHRDELMSQLLSVPTLPAGTYNFKFSVLQSDGELIDGDQESVSLEATPTIQLIDPQDGGNVSSIYPLFKWNSTGATRNCKFGIRICEYNPDQHSSLEESLNDISVFPYPDNGGFVELDPNDPADFEYVSETTGSYQFRYDPSKGGRDLQEGHQYVWEVQKYCTTTSGLLTVESEIHQFSVGVGASDPVKTALESILGQGQYNKLFDVGGKLAGYNANPAGIIIDGEVVEMTRLLRLSRAFEEGRNTLINVQVAE